MTYEAEHHIQSVIIGDLRLPAGNYGASTTRGDSANTSAILGSITEPPHAQSCIAAAHAV